MHEGVLLVPLTSGFAFISPTMLVVACPLLALLPLTLLWFRAPHSVARVAGYGMADSAASHRAWRQPA